MAAKKILFLVGDFAEDYEVMVPFQALTGSGISSMRRARQFEVLGTRVSL